jgi:Xaa-Pro dipeptidase
MAETIAPITEPPAKQEIEARLSKVRSLMQREELDVYVTYHTDNVYYLTNFAYIPFERPFFLVIPLDGKPILVIPGLEVSHAEDRVLLDVEYRTYYEFPAPAGQTYADVLQKAILHQSRIGVESSLPLAHQQMMAGNLKIVDIVDEARLVKSDYEVGRIMYAADVVGEGLKKIFELSQPNAQQLTLYGEGVRQMMGKAFLEIQNPNMLVCKFIAAVWPKSLSAKPHSVPGLFDVLEEGGPQVAIVTAQADGYSAEIERTYFIGNVPEECKKPFNIALEARALAYRMVRPGVRCAEVDEAVLSVIRDHGYGDRILHRTGHGFGITGHEPPWVALGSEEVLEKNMLISIEPGIYIPDLGGFRHSDTVLVTEDGCLSLTAAPERLEDLII